MFAKIQAGLEKLVGPNAAHMLDALIAVALVGVPTLVGALIYSAPARLFLLHHATLGAVITGLVGIGVPAVTALASKFRKAAGSQATLVDEIAKVVEDALAKSTPPATPPTSTSASRCRAGSCGCWRPVTAPSPPRATSSSCG